MILMNLWNYRFSVKTTGSLFVCGDPMAHAIEIRQTGDPEVLNRVPIDVGEPGGARARRRARATSGSIILTS